MEKPAPKLLEKVREVLRLKHHSPKTEELHYEVEVDEDVIVVLRERAQKKGVTISRLVSDLLRQHIFPTT
ncbi:MAG TPA: hypothetical protein VFL17_17845 [Anaerolineae bacterium]|nr:hypothetical protein [Anaerolineae bacterium]